MQPSSRKRLCGPADDLAAAAAGSSAAALAARLRKQRYIAQPLPAAGIVCDQNRQPAALPWQARGAGTADSKQHISSCRVQQPSGSRRRIAGQQDVPMAPLTSFQSAAAHNQEIWQHSSSGDSFGTAKKPRRCAWLRCSQAAAASASAQQGHATTKTRRGVPDPCK